MEDRYRNLSRNRHVVLMIIRRARNEHTSRSDHGTSHRYSTPQLSHKVVLKSRVAVPISGLSLLGDAATVEVLQTSVRKIQENDLITINSQKGVRLVCFLHSALDDPCPIPKGHVTVTTVGNYYDSDRDLLATGFRYEETNTDSGIIIVGGKEQERLPTRLPVGENIRERAVLPLTGFLALTSPLQAYSLWYSSIHRYSNKLPTPAW
jgi:hypothetical protein